MERKRTIFWADPETNKRAAVASLSGLDYLRAIKDGRISPAPVAMLVGYRISDVVRGRAVVELEPEEYLYNPFATVHGGIVTTLLDTAMASAVLSMLAKGMSCSTIEIKSNFVRPITAGTGTLRCEARPVHLGKPMATAEGRLKDKRGELYAHGISTLSIAKAGEK